MEEIWEKSFKKNSKMWGDECSLSTKMAYELVKNNNASTILIPGFGYGRNAKLFLDNKLAVTGIEISKSAINIARENNIDCEIYHGSVSDMPINDNKYDAIYSYCLLHLLDHNTRVKFIEDCYKQLNHGGIMIFVTISPLSIDLNKHTKISHNYYNLVEDLNLYFYDKEYINKDFCNFGLKNVVEIKEPQKSDVLHLSMIICKK